MSLHNPNCDGSDEHCRGSLEVRTLPLGGGANLIVCRACFDHEMAWRKAENQRGVAQSWDIPDWDSLMVYPEETFTWECTNERCRQFRRPFSSPPGGGGVLVCDCCGEFCSKL